MTENITYPHTRVVKITDDLVLFCEVPELYYVSIQTILYDSSLFQNFRTIKIDCNKFMRFDNRVVWLTASSEVDNSDVKNRWSIKFSAMESTPLANLSSKLQDVPHFKPRKTHERCSQFVQFGFSFVCHTCLSAQIHVNVTSCFC